LQDAWGVAISLFGVGLANARKGDYATAQGQLEEALALWPPREDVWSRAETLGLLGEVLERQQEVHRAGTLYGECLTLSYEIGDKSRCGFLLRHLAKLAQGKGLMERSLLLYAAADRWESAEGGVFATLTESAEQAQAPAALRAHLSEEAYGALWAQGQAMTLEQAIEVALSVPDLA
jgi:hypothetical protein